MVRKDMIELLLILKLLIITYVLSDLGSFIGELIDMVITTKNKLLGVIKSLLVYLLSCNKCFSFWFSLILSGDLLVASIVAILIIQIKTIETYFKRDTKI